MTLYPITKTYLVFLINNWILILVYLFLINWQLYIDFNILSPYHINNCYILIILNYIFIFYFSYYNEKFYTKQFHNQVKYSDLTIEFKNLDEKYKNEEDIIDLFNNLTNNSVKEVSLIYNLSNYFRIKKDFENETEEHKKNKIKEKLESHLSYFNQNKDTYFLNRGFITFNNCRSAYLFKELINKIKNKKYLIPKTKKIEDDSKTVDSQIKYYKNSIKNPEFNVVRGINPELINFKYNVKKKMDIKKIILYSSIILVFLPILAFIVNILYFQNFINSNKDYTSKKEYFFEYFYTVILIIIDQIAFYLIDWFLIPKRFLKKGALFSYKFYFYNIYILLANIILPTYSMKITYSNFIRLHSDSKIKKLMVDSLYMNYYLVVFDMINYKLLKPLIKRIFKYIFKKNKKTTKVIESIEDHSIIFSFAYISSCIMYISFFCFLTPKVVIIMLISLIFLFVLDFLNRKNKDFENLFPINLFGNFWTYLAMILFPSIFIGRFIIAPTFISNDGFQFVLRIISFYNHINFIDSSINRFLYDILDLIYKNKILLLFTLIYILIVIIYFILYSNDTFLKRIQSKIWKNKLKNNIKNVEIIGKSYRNVNPIYSLNN